MKKICIGILCAMLLLTAACGENPAQEAPDSTSAAPTEANEAYASVIAIYSYYLENMDNEELLLSALENAGFSEEQKYQVESSMTEIRGSVEAAGGDSRAILGYSIYDINKDGVEELIVRSEDFFTIHSIFTLKDNEPVLLGAYWSRSRCTLRTDGVLYYEGSSGADDSTALILTLPAGGTAFVESPSDGFAAALQNPMILDYTPIT